MASDNAIKLFGLNNIAIEAALQSLESEHGVDLGKSKLMPVAKEDFYYPQFDAAIRLQAASMSKHYEVVYCLEKSIRDLIVSKLKDVQGAEWWKTAVPPQVQVSASANMQREIDSGVTVRSDHPIDYTTFGELGEILKFNWSTFEDIFNSKRAVEKVLSNLNLLRGPIAHCSPLAPDEVVRLQLSVKDWFRLME
ncbi:Swt1 family HEPN domain-containing protein [Lacipirellula sp.]|uniref:Swt1 family HEPN domain-containing protein n=1 Tax=Lacipirellula sp. TaxID=2691419 RepID=UPI003D116438